MTPQERFIEWFLENYPENCILSKPAWHAPKIWRAAIREAQIHAVAAPSRLDAVSVAKICKSPDPHGCGYPNCDCARQSQGKRLVYNKVTKKIDVVLPTGLVTDSFDPPEEE